MNDSLPNATQRLAALRQQLTKHKVDCFIQTTNDAHQSEYVGDRDKRLGFISCFTGSAGKILISQSEALLWTDGRYFEQAAKQLSPEWTLMKQGQTSVPKMQEYVSQAKHKKDLFRIGIDPALCSISFYKRLAGDLSRTQAIVSCVNLVDEIWQQYNQPPHSKAKIFQLDLQYNGQPTVDKIKNLQTKLAEKECYAMVVPKLDHIAWLLNLRGNDITYNPVFISYCVVTLDGCILYTDLSKLGNNDTQNKNESENENKNADEASTASVREYLESINVTSKDYNDFLSDLQSMVAKQVDHKFWLDIRHCNLAIWNAIPEQQRFEEDDPIELAKALKNKTELQGMVNCHIRDGAAKTRFFAWVDQLRQKKQLEQHTEWSFAEKLLQLRSGMEKFVDLSFPSISSSAGNGAIIHYGPTAEKHSPIKPDDMYLLDSGAQYLDGTTDVTRTVWLGIDEQPSDHHRECYTAVLKGVISLSMMVFPSKTPGPTLDMIARRYLWQLGLDYRHGTGHGVGHFLNVHEGPQGFSASTLNKTLYKYGLQTGMVITNEPGYYETGNFGIRIENVMVVVDAKTKHNFEDKGYCTFKTITMVPLDRSLIKVDRLDKTEVEWIDQYHAQVRETLMPFMTDDSEKQFLIKNTDPL